MSTPAITAVERAGVRYVLHEYELSTLAPLRCAPLSGSRVCARRRRAHRLSAGRLSSRDRACRSRPRSPRIRRGCDHERTSPLGQRKQLPTHVDGSALAYETILVNGGRRGLQLELAPDDLVRLTDARVHAIASPRKVDTE